MHYTTHTPIQNMNTIQAWSRALYCRLAVMEKIIVKTRVKTFLV